MKKIISFFSISIIILGLFFSRSVSYASDELLPEPCGLDKNEEAVCELDNFDEGNSDKLIVPDGKEGAISYTLFHLETCPHCRDEIKFIKNTIMPKYGQYIDLKIYDAAKEENRRLFQAYGEKYGVSVGSVPTAFINGEIVRGYGRDETTGKQILGIIESGLAKKKLIEAADSKENGMNIPIIGEIDPKNVSLPLLTLVLGLLDGFNPCAMWVLIFLISLLLAMKDKKKMWLLGSIFIFISGLSYFMFMAAWLQLILFIGLITAVRAAIGAVAIAVGGMSLKDYWKNRNIEGVVCKVSGKKEAKSTFEKIKNVVYRKSLLWSILGISLLGFSVNLVELACSAGFPAIFTQVLAMNDIGMFERYAYTLGYIFFYMLDDMIVFGIAMKTLQIANGNNKYAKYANLFSGVLILILGILLIFKPEWLMFT